MRLKEPLTPQPISLRDLSEKDIPFICNYWFRSPPGFLESIAIDPAKLPTEPELEKYLIEKIQANLLLPTSKLDALAILYDNQPIGIHTIYPLTEGDFGVVHAQLCNPEMRGRGLGMYSYPMACRAFIQRFNLKRILFKTPQQNIGALRVKEKLGIRCIGEEIIGSDITKDGTLAKVFEVIRSELGME